MKQNMRTIILIVIVLTGSTFATAETQTHAASEKSSQKSSLSPGPSIAKNINESAVALFEQAQGTYKRMNYAGAEKLYRTAAEKGSWRAAMKLADMYREADGVAENYPEAERLGNQFRNSVESAATRGDADAMFWCWRITGKHSWLVSAAEAGHLKAQHMAAMSYSSGLFGVPANPGEASKWYARYAQQAEKLADLEDAELLDNLGSMYYFGNGVSKDLTHSDQLESMGSDSIDMSFHGESNQWGQTRLRRINGVRLD